LLQKKIQSIVDQLPEKCKAVFELSRVEGKSHAEISELLDISKKTIENHMTRALRSLREGLKEQELLFLIGLIIIGLGDYGVLCNTILNS